jgi:glycosyltransferase involved in cell wall biosynthesis
MRVCVITVAGYVHGIGGMQDHTVDLIRGLVSRGIEVEAIAPRHPDGVTTTMEHEGATWHFVPAPSRRERLPMRHPAWHSACVDAFASIHAVRPFDVVHSESTSALGLVHAGWHRRVPVVAKFHGNYLTFARTAMRSILAREDVVREAKAIVWLTAQHYLTRGNWYAFRACEAMVPSHAQRRDTIRSHLLRSSSVHVVPNGIDPDAFSPGGRAEARTELGLDGRTYFAWLGRMYRGKGVEYAIAALARTHESVCLLLVGDGESRSELELLASKHGVAGRIVFAGVQPRERMPTYLRAADGLVFPSLLPESGGLAPVQAMSCGLPVVMSRVGALPELLGDSETTGVLVEAADVDGLASAMQRLAEDLGLRERLGAGARARVLAEYTLDRMMERTLGVYERARLRREH